MERKGKVEDAVVVGAGPIGLACAISARRQGLDPLVLDAGALANSIVHYPIGMRFFTTPESKDVIQADIERFADTKRSPRRLIAVETRF